MGPKTLFEWQRRRTIGLIQNKRRDLGFLKNRARTRAEVGRTLAHLKQIELKEAVQNIRNLEKGGS